MGAQGGPESLLCVCHNWILTLSARVGSGSAPMPVNASTCDVRTR